MFGRFCSHAEQWFVPRKNCSHVLFFHKIDEDGTHPHCIHPRSYNLQMNMDCPIYRPQFCGTGYYCHRTEFMPSLSDQFSHLVLRLKQVTTVNII